MQEKSKSQNQIPHVLNEKDFLPPPDTRWTHGGDFTYYAYVREYYRLCDEEEVFDEKIYKY